MSYGSKDAMKETKGRTSTTLLRAMDNSVKEVFYSKGKEARIVKAQEEKKKNEMDLSDLIKQME